MIVGGLKALPIAAAVAALSARDAVAYAGIASMLSAIVVVGSLISAAKAWRQRAEARADEAEQLKGEALRRDADLDDVRHELGKVQAELAARPDIRETAEEMRRAQVQILASLKETAAAVRTAADAAKAVAVAAHVDHVALVKAVDRNTDAVTSIPWSKLT